MSMFRNLCLAALASLVAAPAAHAQATAAKTAVNDALFAAAAASGGMAELALSELGVQRATDPELKKFSEKMIEEHTRMNGELTTLAASQRIPLPRTPDVRAQFCAQSLAGLSGEEFDRCYAKAQLVAHMDSVGTFESEAERGMDPPMKALAAKALPRIKEHLKMIKPIAMRYEKGEK
jgi:putative membrane protein